ncbi:MAG: translesion error-prone DNA polymerase V autoproteolytic subunit [Bacteroidaceae bacterium]|jgi:DNA polymerase V|nr:translesion error-prone DNA polymerase V autoproteolytic subunit [Bacteroidaceae bacterium]
MSNIKIIQGDFNKELKLPIAEGLKAGFPSPAEDYSHETLDFNRDLIHNPESTFYGKVEGDSMIEAGICNNDIAVIDRSIEPRDGDVVVGYVNGEFTIKYLDLRHKKDGYIELRPANKDFKPIRITEEDNFEIWGVVIWTIKHWR